MNYFKSANKKILTIIPTLLIATAIPLTIFFSKQLQRTEQHAAIASPNPVGPSGNWNIVFADEFDDSPGMSGSTNGLAKSKWNSGWQSGPISPGIGNTHAVTAPVIQSLESEYYGPASILFPGDNAVHFRLQKGVDSGGSFAGKNVESGQITTAGLLEFNPANVPISTANPDLRPYTVNGTSVLEVRARMPGPNASGGAYWPAIWMTNAGNYGNNSNPSGSAWPAGSSYSEEIDLTEFYNRGSLGSAGDFHLHSSTEYGGMSSIPSDMQNTDLSLAYHIYTYLFSATAIQLWVDGKPVTAVAPSASQVATEWRSPEYIMLAFQAYSGANYPTAANNLPNDMMIDYVRVWQQCSNNCTPTSVPTNTPHPTATVVPSPTTILQPTPTLNPTATNARLSLLLHGLGKGGDNANPNGGGNTNPLHQKKTITVSLVSSSSQPITKQQGTVDYNGAAGNFTGTIDMGTIPVGNYLVTVSIPGYLSKQLPGIQVVTPQQTTILPSVSLTTGDMNSDNQLDILDYNILISCFGSKAITPSCQNKTAADITDDGTVDGIDYNLFLREVSVQKGN